jgi:hypothetical protein
LGGRALLLLLQVRCRVLLDQLGAYGLDTAAHQGGVCVCRSCLCQRGVSCACCCCCRCCCRRRCCWHGGHLAHMLLLLLLLLLLLRVVIRHARRGAL